MVSKRTKIDVESMGNFPKNFSNTGYFRSDNGPDGIENATHNTFAKQIWMWTRTTSRFALQIYCGLHFQFRQAHHHS
jgi:hypothetical protein